MIYLALTEQVFLKAFMSLQRHHFSQAICILNTDGCNIFDTLSSDQYSQCLDLMRDLILGKSLFVRLVSVTACFMTHTFTVESFKYILQQPN